MNFTAHVVTLLVSLTCMASIVLMVRRGQLRSKFALIWVPTGAGMVVFSAFPGVLNSLASAIGVSYAPSLLFMAAIALLIVVVVHLSWEISRIDDRIQLLAEHIALHSAGVRQRDE